MDVLEKVVRWTDAHLFQRNDGVSFGFQTPHVCANLCFGNHFMRQPLLGSD
jgi:hypothetical protein